MTAAAPTPRGLRSRRATGDSAAARRSERWWHGGDPSRPPSTMRCRRPSPRARPFSSKACASSATARRPSSPRRSRRFTTQEAIHSREHVAFNKRALEAGYDLSQARGAGRMAAGDHPLAAADRQPRRDHGARAFHRDPRPPAARQSAHLAGADAESGRRCGAGTRSRRSSTRASPTTPGCTRRATGRASSAGRSRPR